MKSNALILLFSLFTFFTFAQDSDSEPKGEPHFKVFWNYNYDFSEDVTQTSAFELDRVYQDININSMTMFQLKLLMMLAKMMQVAIILPLLKLLNLITN